MEVTTVEILKAARKLIEKKENWTTKTSARDAEGKSCKVTDENAHQFCVTGAIHKVCTPYADCNVAYSAVVLLDRYAGKSVVDINDREGHEAVLNVLDECIQKLEAQQT